MDRDPDHKAWMSLRLSRVLDDIGANRRVVMKRRDTFLLREAIETLTDKLDGLNSTMFHFGSQSEGSTTPGMNSDIDMLICSVGINMMSEWADWEAGRNNLLMVKEESTPTQHYWLQCIRQDFPEPVRYNGQEGTVPYVDGRVFFSNKIWQDEGKRRLGKRFVSSGPSISSTVEWDFVFAYKCKFLPSEVERWFDRSRRGHWPTPKMLQDARDCSCFLLPDGHFESMNKKIEWRISPSQIERILMFSLTNVQLKCYVVMKMIKQYINEQCLSDFSKLTSFHCKTVMFFTIQRVSPAEWREDRLLQCLSYCIQTLQMFLLKGNCPHYIISEVNLFEGKITRREQNSLKEIVGEFMNCILPILFKIRMDSLGMRMQNPQSSIMERRFTVIRRINNGLAVELIKHTSLLFLRIANKVSIPVHIQRVFAALYVMEDDDNTHALSRYERLAMCILKPHIYSLLASIISSYYIEHDISYRQELFTLYERSFDTDVASSRLKLASMLYCRGELQKAADVLNDVERRYDDNVKALCGCGTKYEGEEMSELLSEITMTDWNYDSIIRKVALCVRFTRSEAFCVPPILLYEMNRAMHDEVQQRTGSDEFWMDMAVVDSRQYLLYMQYLTYGDLGLRLRQLNAFQNLMDCLRSEENIRKMHHFETAANLIGHCWEMEGNLEKALSLYMSSISIVPRNNAANCHIRRLINNM
ncbi:uncharacterized protein LOC128214288 [Mya arenaria]|uniref:uncharacterized protein LOC128214288 n=1 Tax=Mya arenaria TaxID=6604 RepID=UPI0022E9952A|nr:uncharacterized protein LOC128214288 [Mya arenaria]XP_052776643.1 uncharacterized protein LOC128214288 [Mya arenaria]